MSETVNYTININGNAEAVVGKIAVSVNKAIPAISTLSDKFKRLGDAAFALNNMNSVLQNFSASLDSAIQPGIALDSSMKDLSAITGVTGKKLQEIEGYARSAAKTFGGSAAQGVESYKLILSQLSPEIAGVPTALASMGNSVKTLSKTMGGDTLAATEVLTTAMNQFQVSLNDPAQASVKMASMMNVMSAAAKVGSAELPQIKSALEQSGMAAKMAGVSFEELNASIQVLDKAGKKGAEGGVAIRNALSILAEGRFMPEKTQKALAMSGINVAALGDKTKSLSDRLRILQPVLNDSALMTQVFGRENANAGIALISGADQIDEYSKAITGTNAANEQAGIVMGSFAERMGRYSARWDNLKISIFQHTQNAIPAFKASVFAAQGAAAALTVANVLGTASEAAWFVAIKRRTSAMWKSIPATWAMISSQGTWLGVSLLATGATYMLAASVRALGKAIFSIPIIGWIALGVTLLAGFFKLLWDKSEKFRQVLFQVWEVTKAVFTNIGIVIKGLWNNIIKPYFTFIYDLWKFIANEIVGGAVWLWNGLVSVFAAMGQFIYTWLIMPVYNGVNAAIQGVAGFFVKIWGWVSGIFGGVAGWLDNNLLTPIKGVFSQLWEFVSGILDNIINALMKPIKWVKELWNKVFPKDQFKDLGEAAVTGMKKGSESWSNSQNSKTGSPAVTAAIAEAAIPGMGIQDGKPERGLDSGFGGGASGKADTISSGGTRNSSVQITFKNMVENIVFDGSMASKRTDLEAEMMSVMSRVLGMVQSTA